MGCRFPPARFPFVSMCADLIRRRLRLGPILGLAALGFDVIAGPAKRLRFLAQPAGGLSATPLAVQPVVEVVDAGGNRETNQSRDVTLSFGINPTAALLTGTVALASTSGLATFTDV